MNAITPIREEAKMTGDPIRAYLTLATRWDATTRELDGLVAQLTRAAERLRGTAWRKARMGTRDAAGEAQQPMEGWPSAQELESKVASWHQLKDELTSAWERIPAEDRRQMKDPPA